MSESWSRGSVFDSQQPVRCQRATVASCSHMCHCRQTLLFGADPAEDGATQWPGKLWDRRKIIMQAYHRFLTSFCTTRLEPAVSLCRCNTDDKLPLFYSLLSQFLHLTYLILYLILYYPKNWETVVYRPNINFFGLLFSSCPVSQCRPMELHQHSTIMYIYVEIIKVSFFVLFETSFQTF